MINTKIASKNFFYLFILLFIISLTTLSSTSSNSIIQNPNKTIRDSIRKYLFNNPEKAIPFINKFIKQADKDEHVLMGYGALAVAYKIKDDIDSTLFYYNKGLTFCEKPVDVFRFKYDIGKVYENQYNYEYALLLYQQCYNIVEKEGLVEQKSNIKYSLAMMENKIGQPEKALKILRELYLKEKEEKRNIKNIFTIKHLAEIYLNSKKPDSALILIEEGIINAKELNNIELQYHFFKLKTESFLQKKEYNKVIIGIDSTLKKAQVLNNLKFKNQANFLLSQTKEKLGEHLSSISLIKSILNTNSKKTPEEFSKYYKLLAKNYEAVDSSSLSVKYYKKFTKEEKKVTDKRLATLDNIYDIDIKEKINEKEKHKSKSQFWLIFSITIGILGLLLVIKTKINKRKSQKLFDDLMVKVRDYEANEARIKNLNLSNNKVPEQFIISEKNTNNIAIEQEEALKAEQSTTYVVDDEKVEKILEKVKELEDKKYYLNKDCTMHNMAKRLKTNTSYLSQVINNHLDKTFSNYINELRINYVILELKNNKKLRSYSIKAISEELGYKSPYSFSKYFKEATGLTPAVYIKKVNNIS